MRERLTHVRHHNGCNSVACWLQRALRHDGNSAACDRLVGVRAPVGFCAGDSEKRKAGGDLAAIRRDAAHVLHELRRRGRGRQEIAKAHQCPPWVVAAGTLAMP